MFINGFRHRYFSFCFPFSPWLHTRPGRTNQERKKREEGLIARHEQGKGQQLGWDVVYTESLREARLAAEGGVGMPMLCSSHWQKTQRQGCQTYLQKQTKVIEDGKRRFA